MSKYDLNIKMTLTLPSLSPVKILHLNKLLFIFKILIRVPLHNLSCILIFLMISITIEFTQNAIREFCGFNELRYSGKISSPI